MEKMFHVFISSTYSDLIDERKKVSEAVAKAGYVPEGMEIFPASSQSQMSFIERVIDRCDYYILILAGRYGSTAADGISYTEKEYNYALSKKIPVLAFLHKDVSKLSNSVVDDDQSKIDEFKSKFTGNSLVDFWSNADELSTKALAALSQARLSHPGIGWIRGSQAATTDILNDLNNLRKENEELSKTIKNNTPTFEFDGINLADFKDTFTVNYSYSVQRAKYQDTIDLTWLDIIKTIGPNFRVRAYSSSISDAIKNYVTTKKRTALANYSMSNFFVDAEDVTTILIQLEALNIIEVNSDRGVPSYKLKPLGLQIMMRENVVKK